eukprot:COSAG02_NODE_10920_length_1831_cov_2.631088_1_plen_254_part_00
MLGHVGVALGIRALCPVSLQGVAWGCCQWMFMSMCFGPKKKKIDRNTATVSRGPTTLHWYFNVDCSYPRWTVAHHTILRHRPSSTSGGALEGKCVFVRRKGGKPPEVHVAAPVWLARIKDVEPEARRARRLAYLRTPLHGAAGILGGGTVVLPNTTSCCREARWRCRVAREVPVAERMVGGCEPEEPAPVWRHICCHKPSGVKPKICARPDVPHVKASHSSVSNVLEVEGNREVCRQAVEDENRSVSVCERSG